jgi:hypothetical protein
VYICDIVDRVRWDTDLGFPSCAYLAGLLLKRFGHDNPFGKDSGKIPATGGEGEGGESTAAVQSDMAVQDAMQESPGAPSSQGRRTSLLHGEGLRKDAHADGGGNGRGDDRKRAKPSSGCTPPGSAGADAAAGGCAVKPSGDSADADADAVAVAVAEGTGRGRGHQGSRGGRGGCGGRGGNKQEKNKNKKKK